MAGDVGVSSEMQELLAVAATCWDWTTLVERPPQVEHVQAFRRCLALLRPFLSQTLWPDPLGWPGVRQDWDAAEVHYAREYLLLLKRVRALWQQQGAAVQKWGERASWVVRPAWVFLGVLQLVQGWVRSRKLRQQTGAFNCRLAQVRVAVMISQHMGVYEGETLPEEACRTLRVSSSSLRSPGSHRRLRKKQKLSATVAICQEGVSLLTEGPNAGKLVMLLCSSVRIKAAAVSETIDRERRLVFGSSPQAQVVWHAARVHHRCRLLAVPTAACERLGSLLHQQWDAMQGLPAAMLADRVLLLDGKVACVGAPRDEAIVETVCQKLRTFKSEKPYVAVQQVVQLIDEVARSGRAPCPESDADEQHGIISSAELRRERKAHLQEGVPLSLPPALKEAVSAASSGGRLAALPVDVWTVRHTSAASSVAKAHLAEWQQSDEGKKWSESRGAIFQQELRERFALESDTWNFLEEAALAVRLVASEADCTAQGVSGTGSAGSSGRCVESVAVGV